MSMTNDTDDISVNHTMDFIDESNMTNYDSLLSLRKKYLKDGWIRIIDNIINLAYVDHLQYYLFTLNVRPKITSTR